MMHLTRTLLRHRRPLPAAAVWGLAAGFYLVALFHRMSLGVAAPDAEARFRLAPGTIAALTALQLGLYLVMQIPAGLAADRLGPRRVLAIGLALMAAGEVTFGLATTLPVALAGRGLVGIGDACIFLNVLRLAQSLFPAGRYALLASLAGLAGALGQVFTTVPLGIALDGAGWTATFVLTGALTGLLAVLCLALVRDGGPADLAAPGREPMRRALRLAWAAPATRHGLWAHLALMGPFVTVTALWGYPYLIGPQGHSPEAARAHLLACVVAFGVAAPVLGTIAAGRPGSRPALLAGAAAALAGLWSLTLAWPGPAPEVVLLATLLLTGACGAAGLLAFDVAREGNPAARGGAVSGLVNLGGFSAAVLANLAIGRLVSASGGDLSLAMWPLVLVAAAGALMLLRRAVRPAAVISLTPRPVEGWPGR
jgi:predicted MFS family arabinose efflux permease